MKPPTFIECSVCGREFGSKSIQIHEPQCLQKLRRTEIPPTETHQSKPRRKKKLSPPLSNSGNPLETNSAPLPSTQQHPFGVTMDSRKINLPKISTHRDKNSKVSSESSSRSLTRPSTATLAKPKILNIDYIQYDMSLTRIDFSSSSHSPSPVQSQNIMDENHNHKTTHRLTRQNTSVIDPAHRSPFMLPAVSPTSNSRSVLPTKMYKGVDVGLTKLPASSITSINSILGDPLKRTNGASGTIPGFGNDFFPRQSADEFHIETPVSFVSPGCSVTNSVSLPYLHSISSSQCLIKNNDTHLLDKIPEIPRRSERQPKEDFATVTAAFAAANDETNDSKVQDQSQAQRKCCGGQRAACECQYYYTPSKKSDQGDDRQEMFKIEGASLPKEERLFKCLEQRSSQEINKKRPAEEELKKIFVGPVRSSDSLNAFSCQLPVLNKVTKKESTVYNDISSADEESMPANSNFYYKDDFDDQKTSLEENLVHHDDNEQATAQLNKRVVDIDDNVEKKSVSEDRITVSPLMKMINQIKDIPPLYSKLNTPVVVQPNNHEPKADLRVNISSSSVHRLPSNMQQGSGSEGDDEESSTEAEIPIKWTSSWSLVDKKPEIKPVGLSKTRDSVEHLKENKERNSKEGFSSGRKLWKKPSLYEFELGQRFNDVIVKETSIACEINSQNKYDRGKISIDENFPYETVERKSTSKEKLKEIPDTHEDTVSIWEGSTCDISFTCNLPETLTHPRAVPLAPFSHNLPNHNQQSQSKSVPRPNSRQLSTQKKSSKKPDKEERAIADLVSAVFRLEKMQTDKNRPVTQGSIEHYDLDPKYLPEEMFQDRPRTSPQLQYVYRSGAGKTKQRNARGAFTCSNEGKKLYENSLKAINARKEVKTISRPGTPVKPRTANETTMNRIEQIRKIYGAKPASAERLLTPTKDRQSRIAKTATAIQTKSQPTQLKSALKKHTVGDDITKNQFPTRNSKIAPTQHNDITKNQFPTRNSKIAPTQHNVITSRAVAVTPPPAKEEPRYSEKLGIHPQMSRNENKKPREKITVYRKTSCDENRQSRHGSSKKGCIQQKTAYNPMQFYSENPSATDTREKSHFAENNSRDTTVQEAEFNHYEGCRKMKEISHEVSVVTDDNIDICYRIFPSASSKDKVSSMESGRSDTVVNLSARRVKSNDSHSATLKKKSQTRDMSCDNEINIQTKPKKSYSNIELMVPIPFDVSDVEAKSDFVDLNIVVRRKSGNGSYPSLNETNSGRDDKMLLILDESDEEKKVVERTSKTFQTDFGNKVVKSTSKSSQADFEKKVVESTSKTFPVDMEKKVVIVVESTSQTFPADLEKKVVESTSQTFQADFEKKVVESTSQTFQADFEKEVIESTSKTFCADLPVNNNEKKTQIWKTYVGTDLKSDPALADGIRMAKKSERQAYKLYGQENYTNEVPLLGTGNKNSDIFNVDKFLKILFKRVSRMDGTACQKISSGAIFVNEIESTNKENCSDSRVDSEKLNVIRKTIKAKGLKASERDVQQLLSSHIFLNEFLNDFVPNTDEALDNLVRGMVATLTFFGLPNSPWNAF